MTNRTPAEPPALLSGWSKEFLMGKPLLSPELLRKLLRYDPDTGKLYWRERTPDVILEAGGSPSRCKPWNTMHSNREALQERDREGYLRGQIFGKHYAAHRVIWAIETGFWPEHHIDHINGNTGDNRFFNLRCVTPMENSRNMKTSKRNKSGYIGVQRHGLKWRVNIAGMVRGSFYCIGQAIRDRNLAERELGFHKNHGRS